MADNFAIQAPRLIQDLMRDYGVSRETAAAAVGSFAHESARFTAQQEYAYPNDRGALGRGGTGWAQWTNSRSSPRRAAFFNYVNSAKLDPGSYEANYGFLTHDPVESKLLQTALAATEKAKSLPAKAQAFERSFERAGVPAWSKRTQLAKEALSVAAQAPPDVLAEAPLIGSGAEDVLGGSNRERDAPAPDLAASEASFSQGLRTGFGTQAGGEVFSGSGADNTLVGRGGGGGQIEAYIRQAATARGINPDIAVRVARSEGGLTNPTQQSYVVRNGRRETSYGPFQLRIGGGLGDIALRRGIDPRQPDDWQRGVDFALNYAAQHGWGSWYGAGRVGLSNFAGIGRDAHPAGITTGPAVAMAAPAPVATGTPIAPGYVVASDPTMLASLLPEDTFAGGSGQDILGGSNRQHDPLDSYYVQPFAPGGRGPTFGVGIPPQSFPDLPSPSVVPSSSPLPPEVAAFLAPIMQPTNAYATQPSTYTPQWTAPIQPYSTSPAFGAQGASGMQVQSLPHPGQGEGGFTQAVTTTPQHISGPLPPVATFPDYGAGTFAGGNGYTPPPAAPLPIAPSDIQAQGFMGGVPGEMSQMPAAQPAAAPEVAGQSGIGGFVHHLVNAAAPIVHQVVQTVRTGVMPNGQSLGGFLSGIQGFGGGPLPAGVTDKSGFSNFMGAQQWHNPSFNATSGGSTYQYFTPATPGGIGGYVVPAGHPNAGTVYTYPTDPDIYHSVAS